MPKAYGGGEAVGAKQVNRLLNLFLACCVVFMSVGVPALLYRSLNKTDAFFGWRLVAVTGDDMEPAIPAGALVLARELAKEIPYDLPAEGDAVVFALPDGARVKAVWVCGAFAPVTRALLR